MIYSHTKFQMFISNGDLINLLFFRKKGQQAKHSTLRKIKVKIKVSLIRIILDHHTSYNVTDLKAPSSVINM
jgi:hypothetical protein